MRNTKAYSLFSATGTDLAQLEITSALDSQEGEEDNMLQYRDTDDQRQIKGQRRGSLLDAAILASLLATSAVTVFAWVQQV